MRRLRILLLFVLLLLPSGGAVYAQSATDVAEPETTRQEAAATISEKKEAPAQKEAEPKTNEKEPDATAAELPAVESSAKEKSASEGSEKAEEIQAAETEKAEPAKEVSKNEADVAKEEPKEIKKEDAASKSNPGKRGKEEKGKAEAVENNETKVLKQGTVLNPQMLRNPAPQNDGEMKYNEVMVGSFEELKQKLKEAKNNPTKIIITKGFEITETLTIEKDQNIVLTSNDGKKMDDPWKKIEQPKDYAKEGEAKQREVIEEARKRGKEAVEKAEENIEKTGRAYNATWNYVFKEEDIVLKRAELSGGTGFKGTLFNVFGKLTLGDQNNSINFDGNKGKVTSDQEGSFFTVQDGGKLTLNNGVIANGKNEARYTGSVYLHKGAEFTMNGGRISSNEVESASRQIPFTTGGVYVDRGSKFVFNNGMLDHNIGTSAALFVGELSTGEKENLFEHPESAAIAEMNGGYIIGNRTNGSLKFSGGVTVFSGGTFTLKDGIIAANSNYGGPGDGGAGGVYIGDGFIASNSNAIGDEWSNTYSDYKDYVAKNKGEANFNGGLIYDNYSSWAAGGLFIDSEYVGLNRVMILDNRASKWGGGIYYSFPPRVNKPNHMLVTENNAYIGSVSTQDEYWGGPAAGGGLWNCPTGYIHFGDGHSLYIYNNKAAGKGDDISFAKRAGQFRLNGKDIHRDFYSHVSPITEKDNIIKFLNDDRKNDKQFIPGKMSYTDEKMYLRAVYSDKLIKEAWSNANAFILGNRASYGGGVGSNANLTTGDKGTIDFTFKKKWHKDIDKKEYENKKLHIDIFIVPKEADEVYVRSQYGFDNNLFKYGEVILSKDNDWQARFSEWKKSQNKNLPMAEDHGLPFSNEDLAKRGLKYLIVERETGYATHVVQTEKGSSTQYGKLTITKDQSKDWPAGDKRDYGADFYFYELNKDGTATYLGKSKRLGDDTSIHSEFVHPILNNKYVNAVYYGIDEKNPRYVIEYGQDALKNSYFGYLSTKSQYAIFVEKVDGGIVFHVPYLFIQDYDSDENYSGLILDPKEKGGPLVVEPYGYEFTINNSPFGEAKIKKTWKMLTEEEIKQALGHDSKNVEVKHREIPESVTFYVLKEGKRIVIDYKRDENGKVYPIYKTVTLTKKDNWEGIITELDPILLEKGAYGIEEEALKGFKGSYTFERILKNPNDGKNDDKEKPLPLQFRLRKLNAYIDEDGQHNAPGPFKIFMGDITVKLFVDGTLKDSKTMKWTSQTDEFGTINELQADKMFFGYDEDKKILVDNHGHPVKVKYYNVIKNDVGHKDLTLNLYLKKDENGVYSLYIPNVLADGNFVKVFDVVDKDGKTIEAFGQDVKKVEPLYEYIFKVTNQELPPEKPPEEPPHNPPHEPPHEPPTTPPETPEEPPVTPPAPPEVPEKPPKTPPVVPPRKPGEPPQTGVGSVMPYMMLALSSSMGLGYIRRKKH